MKKNEKYRREFSAGGAVYKKEKGKVLWLLGKHSGYKKWTLPKGLIDPGEKSEETALREVEEETGVKGRIVEKIKPAEKYIYSFEGKKVFKVVQYYLMEYVSGEVKDHDWEMEEVKWMNYEQAVRILGFPGQKKVLKRAREMLG